MKWNILNSENQLKELDELSKSKPVLILKHSIRCSISSTVLNRFERSWSDEADKKSIPYYLDLINHRNVSNAIATHYQIAHESPQVLILKNGNCVYSQSHFEINMPEIVLELNKLL